ncbi:MAG: phosphatase PAP2 family protein [Deltaproteobacteria bacterium]|nr:phosphatase PAP2 family protein [Deltaproteobacteria bacterium]
MLESRRGARSALEQRFVAMLGTVLFVAALRGALGILPVGAITALDRTVLTSLREARSEPLKDAMEFVSLLGGREGGIPFVLLVSAALGISGRWFSLTAFLMFGTLGAGLSELLKVAFQRPRPDAALALLSTDSFPSGHAMNSLILIGMTAFILTDIVERRALRVLVIAVSVVLVGLIGFSRVYLGHHWPSDVVGGYMIGGLWLALGIRLQRKYTLPWPGRGLSSSS